MLMLLVLALLRPVFFLVVFFYGVWIFNKAELNISAKRKIVGVKAKRVGFFLIFFSLLVMASSLFTSTHTTLYPLVQEILDGLVSISYIVFWLSLVYLRLFSKGDVTNPD
jgi:hypothetical protein